MSRRAAEEMSAPGFEFLEPSIADPFNRGVDQVKINLRVGGKGAFGGNEPWGVGEWILYAGQWWLPGLLALLAVLSYIARVRALATRRRNNAVISRLLASGSRVDAEIVEAPLPAHDASRMTASLVAKFTDVITVSSQPSSPNALS